MSGLSENEKYSRAALWIAILISAVYQFTYWNSLCLSWDVFGYYLYLPAGIIYKDLFMQNQDWLHALVEKYQHTATLYQINLHPETGNWMIKYSMGMSFLYLPFFLLAHLITLLTGGHADGMSFWYQTLINSGCIIYGVAGLFYLRKILLLFFSDKATAIALLTIYAGTNLLQLHTNGAALTHVPLFGLYTLLIYYTHKFSCEPVTAGKRFILFFICGFITLVRPSEIIALVIPVFWGSMSLRDMLQKIIFFLKNPLILLTALVACILPLLPQLAYWFAGTGQVFYYSYVNPGEGFDFLTPHTYDFLFSFRKGWFIYTPVALLSIFLWVRYMKKWPVVNLSGSCFVVLSVYIVSSWSCWWYAGGSYSQRAILSTYPFLAMALAAGYDALSVFGRKIFSGVITVLLFLNLFQFWQFSQGIIDHERMTFDYYVASFLSFQKPADAENLLLINRSYTAEERIENMGRYGASPLFFNSFDKAEGEEAAFLTDTIKGGSGYCVTMGPENEFINGIEKSFEELSKTDHFWLRISADFFISTDYNGETPLLVAHFEHKDEAYKYRAWGIPADKIVKGRWNHFSFDYLSPEVRSKKDKIKVIIWHRNKQYAWVDHFTVEKFDPLY